MVIMSKTLLNAHKESTIKIVLHGDNQAVQQTCSSIQTDHLKYHRQPNMNLKIEYQKAHEGIHIMNEWTRGRQDDGKEWNSIKDLQNMQLSNLVIMNTWYGRKTNKAQNITNEDADVYLNEK
jgi:hypothetical protein